jgi:hypothetical protein
MSTLELVETLFDYRMQLIVWVLCSILLYGLAANLLHVLRRASSTRAGRLLTALESWPHNLWLFEGLRFCYYLGIPYVALMKGITNPSLMGLWSSHWFGPQWFQELGLGVVLGLGTLALLVWGWRRYVKAAGQMRYRMGSRPYLTERRMLVTPWGWGLIVLGVLYLEVHWAFYRSATIQVLGNYHGTFVSLLLILGEWWLNPQIRKGWGMAHRTGKSLTTAAMAFSITIIYYFTSSTWLCMAIHLILQFGLLSFLMMSSSLLDQEGESD